MILDKIFILVERILNLGSFLAEVRKYKGRFWDIWKDSEDDGTVEIQLCHKKYTLSLRTDEFAELVQAINRTAYGILGKKTLLMGKTDRNKD